MFSEKTCLGDGRWAVRTTTTVFQDSGFTTVVFSLPCLVQTESLPSIPLKWVCGKEAESDAGTQNSDYSECLCSPPQRPWRPHSSCECQRQTLPASNSPYAGSTDKTGRVRGMSSVRTENPKNPFKALGPYSQQIDASLPIEFTPTSQCRKAARGPGVIMILSFFLSRQRILRKKLKIIILAAI